MLKVAQFMEKCTHTCMCNEVESVGTYISGIILFTRINLVPPTKQLHNMKNYQTCLFIKRIVIFEYVVTVSRRLKVEDDISRIDSEQICGVM